VQPFYHAHGRTAARRHGAAYDSDCRRHRTGAGRL